MYDPSNDRQVIQVPKLYPVESLKWSVRAAILRPLPQLPSSTPHMMMAREAPTGTGIRVTAGALPGARELHVSCDIYLCRWIKVFEVSSYVMIISRPALWRTLVELPIVSMFLQSVGRLSMALEKVPCIRNQMYMYAVITWPLCNTRGRWEYLCLENFKSHVYSPYFNTPYHYIFSFPRA